MRSAAHEGDGVSVSSRIPPSLQNAQPHSIIVEIEDEDQYLEKEYNFDRQKNLEIENPIDADPEDALRMSI